MFLMWKTNDIDCSKLDKIHKNLKDMVCDIAK